MDLLLGWQSPIGKAVLESWGFSTELCDAIGDQNDRERRWRHEAGLSDILIASLMLNDVNTPAPRAVATEGIGVYTTVGINTQSAAEVLAEAERQIQLVIQALGAGG